MKVKKKEEKKLEDNDTRTFFINRFKAESALFYQRGMCKTANEDIFFYLHKTDYSVERIAR